MAEVAYNVAKLGVGDGTIALDGPDLWVLILQTSDPAVLNPDLATVAAILALAGVAEPTDVSYTRMNLANTTGTLDNVNNRANFDADDVFWADANWGDVNGVLVYFEGGATDADRIPVCFSDSNSGFPTNGGDLTMTINDFARVT